MCDLTCSTGGGGNCTRTLGWNPLHSFKCIPFQGEFDSVGELGDGVNVQKRGLEVGPLSQYNEPFRVGQRNEHVEPTATLFCLIRVGYHSELRVSITFHQHYRFLPTKLHHILRCAY